MMKPRWIIFTAVLMLIAAYTVPVVPVSLPANVFSEADFKAHKAEIESLAHTTNKLGKQAGISQYDVPDFYTFIAAHGYTNVRRALLGSVRWGYSRTTTSAFASMALPQVPYVIYDHDQHTLQVTPNNLTDVLAWGRASPGYPDVTNLKLKPRLTQ